MPSPASSSTWDRVGIRCRSATTSAALELWRENLERVRVEATGAASKAEQAAREADHTHTEVQGWLRDLGLALGFDVWIASNDGNRPYGAGRLSDGCLQRLPGRLAATASAETVRLIDVIWIDKASQDLAAAFEVEHTTSIYSGIVRMLDLALGAEGGTARNFFLVAPDNREDDVRAQFARPAFSRWPSWISATCPTASCAVTARASPVSGAA